MTTKTIHYIWIRLQAGRYSAGHHDDSGTWIPASEDTDPRDAAIAARNLNGVNA